jgi:arginyl-tRNA synthetase
VKFVISWDYFRNHLIPKVLNQGTKFGSNASGFGKLAVVEYSSPNIAKPFHVGHLRSTIMGSFIQKTLNANGWATHTINYLGDWGKQYGMVWLMSVYASFGSY